MTDPAAKIREYISHRLMREQQVLDCLRAGIERIPDIVAKLYVDVHPALHVVAERSVHAHLLKLIREKKATYDGDRYLPA